MIQRIIQVQDKSVWGGGYSPPLGATKEWGWAVDNKYDAIIRQK